MMLRWCSLHCLNLGVDLWAGAGAIEMLLSQDLSVGLTSHLLAVHTFPHSFLVMGVFPLGHVDWSQLR